MIVFEWKTRVANQNLLAVPVLPFLDWLQIKQAVKAQSKWCRDSGERAWQEGERCFHVLNGACLMFRGFLRFFVPALLRAKLSAKRDWWYCKTRFLNTESELQNSLWSWEKKYVYDQVGSRKTMLYSALHHKSREPRTDFRVVQVKMQFPYQRTSCFWTLKEIIIKYLLQMPECSPATRKPQN